MDVFNNLFVMNVKISSSHMDQIIKHKNTSNTLFLWSHEKYDNEFR